MEQQNECLKKCVFPLLDPMTFIWHGDNHDEKKIEMPPQFEKPICEWEWKTLGMDSQYKRMAIFVQNLYGQKNSDRKEKAYINVSSWTDNSAKEYLSKLLQGFVASKINSEKSAILDRMKNSAAGAKADLFFAILICWKPLGFCTEHLLVSPMDLFRF